MKILNGCTPLENATALHDYHLYTLNSDTRKWYIINLLTRVGNEHIIVVDGETILGHLPCEISSINFLTLPRVKWPYCR